MATEAIPANAPPERTFTDLAEPTQQQPAKDYKVHKETTKVAGLRPYEGPG